MKSKSKSIANGNAVVLQEQYRHDCKQLTNSQLKAKYKLTYDSWRSVKQRAKKQGIHLDQQLESFATFLYKLGPRMAKAFTLDRIDCKGPYTPANCRWANKQTQTLNRSNAVRILWNGESLPLKVCAARLGVSTDVLYKRKQQGWTDEEIIAGMRTAVGGRPFDPPWPLGKESTWELLFRNNRFQDETRDEFYLRVCKSRFEQAKASLNSYRDKPVPRDVELEFNEARQCLSETQEKLADRRKRRKNVVLSDLFGTPGSVANPRPPHYVTPHIDDEDESDDDGDDGDESDESDDDGDDGDESDESDDDGNQLHAFGKFH